MWLADKDKLCAVGMAGPPGTPKHRGDVTGSWAVFSNYAAAVWALYQSSVSWGLVSCSLQKLKPEIAPWRRENEGDVEVSGRRG